jgi:hypothetical protein
MSVTRNHHREPAAEGAGWARFRGRCLDFLRSGREGCRAEIFVFEEQVRPRKKFRFCVPGATTAKKSDFHFEIAHPLFRSTEILTQKIPWNAPLDGISDFQELLP